MGRFTGIKARFENVPLDLFDFILIMQEFIICLSNDLGKTTHAAQHTVAQIKIVKLSLQKIPVYHTESLRPETSANNVFHILMTNSLVWAKPWFCGA